MKKIFQKLISGRKTIQKKFALYEYKNEDGTFDYKKYVGIQTEGNKKKLDRSWVTEPEIEFIASILKDRISLIKRGICHGTRQGLEQKWFKEKLSCEVIGTEISDTAKEFPDTVQWDFHEVNEDWINQFDFVYTNSFDHAYDPEKALSAWMGSLKQHGLCIIEHTNNHSVSAVSQLDPFGVELEYLPYLVLQWSKGKFSVREIITSPFTKEIGGTVSYVIIQRN